MDNSDQATRDEKIKKIYEVIADKTPNEGCVVKFVNQPSRNQDTKLRHFTQVNCKIVYANYNRLFVSEDKYGPHILWEGDIAEHYEDYDNVFKSITEIIGHPVMIGDVLDYHEKDMQGYLMNIGETEELFNFWKEKRKPIELQDDDCINFIYGLL